MIANCLNEDPVSSLAEKSTEDGSAACSSSASLPLIGEPPANEDEDDNMQDVPVTEACCIKELDKVKVKEESAQNVQKSLQSLQMFENGEFITKYLEVDSDADVPKNKLNGTIQYSSDYRLAENPDRRRGMTGYTSSSENSTSSSNSGSDTSEKSGNSSNGESYDASKWTCGVTC